MTPVLELEGLAVGYRNRRRSAPVLQDLSATLAAGELVCLLGPNGAGKSTLLRTVAGLQAPLAGRVVLLGRDLVGYSPRQRARRVGVVLPEKHRTGFLDAAALVALGRHPHTGWSGRLSEDDLAKVDDALARTGARHLAERDVLTLSDGERQRVMIARALAQEPTLLLLDEPTAFLDLSGRVEVMGLLRSLVHRGDAGAGRAVLLSTHDLDLALRTADRLWLLRADGSLVAGAPEDLVLSGVFQEVWRSAHAEFDLLSGSWRFAAATSAAVRLAGEGPAATWTARALERAGYRVLAAGEATRDAAGEVGGEVAVAVGEGPVWDWRRGSRQGRAGSIAELLAGLREVAGGAGKG